MKKFKVVVAESVHNEMTIEAESENEAKTIAKNIITSRTVEIEKSPAPSIDSISKVIMETICEEIKMKCQVCADTGIVKYHDIDGITIFGWQPYKTKKCDYCQ